MPYWASVWPVSRALAVRILNSMERLSLKPQDSLPALVHSASEAPQLTVLELGCGLGLAGVAALKAGHRVTFSDYDASALSYAKKNAELNGFSSCNFLELNWKAPQPIEFDWIIGADLTWDLELVPHLINVFSRMLKPNGVIWLADQNRLDQVDFLRRLEGIGMNAAIEPLNLDPAWGWDIAGSFYEIRRVQAK